MTNPEALKNLVASFKIDALRICAEYDPGAGSTYEYSPSEKGLATLTTLLGRQATEDDLFFYMGSAYKSDCYRPLPATDDALVASIDQYRILLLELYQLCRHLGGILTSGHQRRIETALGIKEHS